MKNVDLELIRKLALQATEGEWMVVDERWSEGENAEITTQHRLDNSFSPIAVVKGGGAQSDYDEPFMSKQQVNAAYIAAANPEVVLKLIYQLEKAEAQLRGA